MRLRSSQFRASIGRLTDNSADSRRAQTGPGVELLEYLTPRTGRPYPSDSVASDQWQWVVNLRAQPKTASESIDHLRDQTWISNRPTRLKDNALGYAQAFMLRDPDGHADNLILQ